MGLKHEPGLNMEGMGLGLGMGLLMANGKAAAPFGLQLGQPVRPVLNLASTDSSGWRTWATRKELVQRRELV